MDQGKRSIHFVFGHGGSLVGLEYPATMFDGCAWSRQELGRFQETSANAGDREFLYVIVSKHVTLLMRNAKDAGWRYGTQLVHSITAEALRGYVLIAVLFMKHVVTPVHTQCGNSGMEEKTSLCLFTRISTNRLGVLSEFFAIDYHHQQTVMDKLHNGKECHTR